jgi:hypothetical protein
MRKENRKSEREKGGRMEEIKRKIKRKLYTIKKIKRNKEI